jgi:hypothetical protein
MRRDFLGEPGLVGSIYAERARSDYGVAERADPVARHVARH